MQRKKGFTLIEMVVVLAIIAILLAAAIPRLAKTKRQAEIVVHNANVDMVRNAAILYQASEGVKTGDITKEVEEYLEDGYPPIPAGTDADHWTVTLKADGAITITPGTMEP